MARLDKVLFPRDGLTKGDLIDYYSSISSAMLPHVRGRPVTMVRLPDGLDGERFFQKEAPPNTPPWFRTAEVKKAGGAVRQLVCEKEADLVFLANQACITPHVWLSKEDRLDRPDRLIFDLDPPEKGFALARRTALALRDLLHDLGISSFVMTTGSKGLHVTAPLDRSAGFEEARALARDAASLVVREDPDKLTLDVSKEEREVRLFIDTVRNAYGQTGVAPYAVRAKDGAPVATPLAWDELKDGEIGSQSFNMQNVLRRLDKKGDPWESIDRRLASVADARTALRNAPK